MRWFRYVPLADVGVWLAKGWAIADDLALVHHGAYSVLMVWAGKDLPPEVVANE